jgi:uncharacterized membrane protein YeiH
MLTHTATLQLALDLVGVFVFALSGGLTAVQRRFDLFGVLVLAAMAGLGGGMMRDVLIGQTPPVGLSDWRLLAAAGLAGLVTFTLHSRVARISRLVRVLDAAGLGAFAVGGTLKALGVGVGPVAAVLVGGITAVGGGVLRDVLAGQVPEVLRRELYAVPALLGATLVALASRWNALSSGVIWGCAGLVFAIRVLAVMLDLNAPKPLRTGDQK